MTGGPEGGPCGTGLSWFALQRLPPLFEAFEKEMAGVRKADDIEYIHRMRVASRRLRAALPLFHSCFPKKQYALWMEEITAITQALGEARDTDVQIAFLEKFRKKAAAARAAKQAGNDPVVPDPMEPGLVYLLLDLRDRRRKLQVSVIRALDDLERSGALAGMQAFFAGQAGSQKRTPVRSLALGIPTRAAERILSRLSAMLAFEPWVAHADAVAEHHAMRIAAKKLRYTMEVYGPVYRRGLKKPHARVKKVQEILGDLHDCDVWIDDVTRLLLRERGRLRTGDRRPDTATLAGLRLFLRDRERERTLIHRRFMRYWQGLVDAGEWDALRKTLDSGRKRKYVPAKGAPDEEILAAAGAVAAANPARISHQRIVTRLAVMLFDSLQPLHALSAHDRCLLECAGMLHDISRVPGAKRHHILSAQHIFSDESLPLDIVDRTATGLIALAHRGKRLPGSHPLFALLPLDRRNGVLRLAALLRIANALDCLNAGTVQEIHCVIGEREVSCDIIASGDVIREKERAQARSDLFLRAFDRVLVIR